MKTLIRKNLYRLRSTRSKFREYYRQGSEKSPSTSGPGSDLIQTAFIQKEIPSLLKEIRATSMLDAPCGDFYWMKEVNLDIEYYVGIDIVGEVIASNKAKHDHPKRVFLYLDITKDKLPKTDLVLCRDCLVHFSFKDIFRTLKNFKKSHASYLLTTTFTDLTHNEDIVTGGWRPLNLQNPPFYFPEPIKIINEHCSENGGLYSDKSLGLWKMSSILE